MLSEVKEEHKNLEPTTTMEMGITTAKMFAKGFNYAIQNINKNSESKRLKLVSMEL